MIHQIGHMTKIHVDDFINCHVMGCNKLAVNWFVAKLYHLSLTNLK
jgi:hypothetical protein